MVAEITITISTGIIVSMEAKLNLARNHASLENLDYAHSGHTGFASSQDLAGKQDKLTAGTGISIQNNVISVTGGGGDVTEEELTQKLALKQDVLTAGTGISISGSTISANVCVVIETGALVKKLYSDLSPYKLIICYGYRDALNAPNQFCFCFMPDQLQVNGEDLQFLAMAGSSNWQYPLRVKRHSDGYVYWYSGYDYSGNTTFFVTKILGVK